MTVKIEEYVTCEQKNYYAEWFNDLSVEYAAKVAVARASMMAGSMGNVKSIDGKHLRNIELIGDREFEFPHP